MIYQLISERTMVMSEQGDRFWTMGCYVMGRFFWRDERKDERWKVSWEMRNRGQSRRVYISWNECCITHGMIG